MSSPVRPRPGPSPLHPLSPWRVGAALLLSAATLAAQEGTDPGAPTPPAVGGLWFYSNSVQGGSSSASALVRWDPLTAQGAVVVDTLDLPDHPQQAAYDPWRGGVLFVGQVAPHPEPTRLWMTDDAGALVDLGLPDVDFSCLAPAPDGKLYGVVDGASNPGGRVQYLGQDGQLHDLLDASGSAPFEFAPGGQFPFEALAYHEPTRSLVAALPTGTALSDCAFGPATDTVLRSVPLAADGTRVAGPVRCASFDVGQGPASEFPCGFSRLPDGDLLLTVRTSSGAKPRLLRVRPQALAVSVFAVPGPYAGDASVGAGTWSRALGQALLHDSSADDLRAFSEGEGGDGTLLGVQPATGTPGLAGGQHTLFEIHRAPCEGSFASYGDGLAGSGGFVPSLAGTGCPDAGVTPTLHVALARGGSQAALFLGLDEAALPFKGGLLLAAPILLTAPFVSGGPVGAAGEGFLDLPLPLPTTGVTGVELFLQAAVADPAAPAGVALSAGLLVTVG